MAIQFKDLPKCIHCSEDILYYDTVVQNGLYKRGKSALSKKGDFPLVVCEKCLTVKFPNYQSCNKSRVFNRMCRETQYAFNIPEDVYKKEHIKLTSRSLENFVAKYGKVEGTEKWEAYKKKQSVTNTFDYKKQVYGMTEDEFINFNKSRAVTLRNMVKKYGEEGKNKFEEYRAKQKHTKTWDYMVEKYGIQKARSINKSKGLTLANYQLKHGVEEGAIKYQEAIQKHNSFCSKISQKFFHSIDAHLGKQYTTYYHSKNTEYGVNLGSSYVKLDYYILELNLCIEFNGTLFHADERVFSNDALPNPYSSKTAAEIRKEDCDRYLLLKEKRGIQTHIMWQLDYDEKTFNPLEYISNTLNISLNESVLF
jgi:hypothetical protein